MTIRQIRGGFVALDRDRDENGDPPEEARDRLDEVAAAFGGGNGDRLDVPEPEEGGLR